MATKIARCSRGKCRRRPRAEGRYCTLCHAAANRRSHRKHHKERNARRRDRAKNRDEIVIARDSARAKLYVAIARGTIEKGTCVVCQRHDDVVAFIIDPAEWKNALWACRDHRDAVRRSSFVPSPQNVGWAAERNAAFTAAALLPDAERAELFEIAARGPAGVRIDVAAPLFAIQLVRAYQKRYAPKSLK